MDDQTIGNDIGSPEERQRWRELVLALHEAAEPGGPLDGWAFHGTAAIRARSMEAEGMRTTRAQVDTGEGVHWTDATHWGTPKVAAFYAEDLIETYEDPDLDLVVVAVRIEDLKECGHLEPDGQTVESPILSRIEFSEEEAYDVWQSSSHEWQDCYAAFGSFLVLGGVPAEDLRFVRTAADLDELISMSTAARAHELASRS